jgi:site-specific recombinase XerD
VFLDSLDAATTRTGYARTLARLAAVTGPHHPVADLDCDHYAAVMVGWDSAAPATWNRHPSALVSFTTWAQLQDLLATDPARRLSRRKTTERGDRAISAPRLEKLFTDDRHPLRELLLWRLLYEAAARAEEVLSPTSKTSTPSSAVPASSPRAAPSSTCTGPPTPPACCPAC